MNWYLFALGAALVLSAALDPLWTTLWVDGHAGPLTRRYGDTIRRVFWRIVPDHDHRLLSLAGPVVLVVTVLLWALLLWIGWVVLYSADPSSLRQAHTGVPAGFASRVYFTGYTMFTLGNGDYAPQGSLWEIVTSVASLSGLFLLTLSVTYVLAVIEAVVAKRSFASQVWALAHSAEELVTHTWGGRAFPAVELQIVSLTEQLNLVTEQHHAYPMLHFYHEERLPQSVSVGLAIFDDALTIWQFAVPLEVRPAPAALRCARQSVREFLDSLQNARVEASRNTPPSVDLSWLRDARIPTLGADAVAESGELDKRRRLLLGFLESEHRDWPSPGRYA